MTRSPSPPTFVSLRLGRRPAGFSLVEVTLALAVTAFCLLAIFGLLPIGLKNNQASIEQTVANSILSAVAADLRATPPTSPPGQAVLQGNPAPNGFNISIPANPVMAAPPTATLYFTGEGKPSTSPATDSRYRLTVDFPSNGSSARAATFVNLQVSWPAAVALSNATGSVQTFVALDRN